MHIKAECTAARSPYSSSSGIRAREGTEQLRIAAESREKNMMKLSLLASVAALLVQDAHGFAGSAMGRTFSRQHVVVATRATQLPAQRGLRMSVGDNVKDAVKDAMGEVGADASGGYVKKLKNWWAEKIPAADGLSHASSISEESKPIQVRRVHRL